MMNVESASKAIIGLINQLNVIPSSKLEGKSLRDRITKISTEANKILCQVRATDLKTKETLKALTVNFNRVDNKVIELVQDRLGSEAFLMHGVREFV